MPTPGIRVMADRTTTWPVVHGSVGSAKVTLFDCTAQRSSFHMTVAAVSGDAIEAEQQLIRVELMLLGALLDDKEQTVFSGVDIEIENLTAWHAAPDVRYSIDNPENPAQRRKWRIEVEPVDSVSVDVDQMSVKLSRSYRLPSHDLRRGRLSSSTFGVSHLELRSEQPRTAEEWSDAAQGFQDLLSLAMDSPCAILRMTLIPTPELFESRNAEARAQIRIVSRHIVVGDPDASGVAGEDALFTMGVEGVEFESFIPLWLTVYTRFRVTLNMILGLRYVDAGYVQTELMTAVAAAEAMHDALDREPPISNSEFKGVKKLLLECVPEERRQWLREKLGRNTHSLKQRLVYLTTVPDADVMRALLPNPEAWAEEAKKARNAVAHGGESGEDIRLQHAITQVVRAVVIMNLLHDLNIPTSRLNSALTENQTLRSARRLAAEFWPLAANGTDEHNGDVVDDV